MKSQSEPFKVVRSLFAPLMQTQLPDKLKQRQNEEAPLQKNLFSFSLDQKHAITTTPDPQPMKRKKRSYNLTNHSLTQPQIQQACSPPPFRISDLRLFLVSALPDRCQMIVSVVRDLSRVYVIMEKQNRLLITYSEGPRTQFLLDPFCDLEKLLAVRNDLEFKDDGELVAIASRIPLSMKYIRHKKTLRIQKTGDTWQGKWEDKRTCLKIENNPNSQGVQLRLLGQLSILQGVFVISLIGSEMLN